MVGSSRTRTVGRCNGLRQLQPPDHAPRKILGELVGGFGQAHEVQGFGDAPLAFSARNSVELAEEIQIFVSRQGAIGGEKLGNVADPAPHLTW